MEISLEVSMFMDQIDMVLRDPILIERFNKETCENLIKRFNGKIEEIYNYLEENYLYAGMYK